MSHKAESEMDRINREAQERFDRDMDEYLESPEFVMCECAKGVRMSVSELVDLVKPTLPQMDPRYADAVKTYLNWVKNTEHEADTLCRLAKTNSAQARVSLDLWDAALTKDPPEYNRLATEIEAAGKNPAWKELDDLRWNLYHSVSVFLREVRLYLDGKPSTDYAKIAAEQATAANAKIQTPRPQVREDMRHKWLTPRLDAIRSSRPRSCGPSRRLPRKWGRRRRRRPIGYDPRQSGEDALTTCRT